MQFSSLTLNSFSLWLLLQAYKHNNLRASSNMGPGSRIRKALVFAMHQPKHPPKMFQEHFFCPLRNRIILKAPVWSSEMLWNRDDKHLTALQLILYSDTGKAVQKRVVWLEI